MSLPGLAHSSRAGPEGLPPPPHAPQTCDWKTHGRLLSSYFVSVNGASLSCSLRDKCSDSGEPPQACAALIRRAHPPVRPATLPPQPPPSATPASSRRVTPRRLSHGCALKLTISWEDQAHTYTHTQGKKQVRCRRSHRSSERGTWWPSSADLENATKHSNFWSVVKLCFFTHQSPEDSAAFTGETEAGAGRISSKCL